MLGDNIRYLRLKQGYSQDYIAECLGYKSYTTIQKWESGVSEPPVKKLKELSVLLNADMDDMANKDLSAEDSVSSPRFMNLNNYTAMTVGDRIRNQRENLGLTQTELAEKVAISKQTLYKYEMNIITNIPSDKLEHISKILGVSPAYLMGWSDVSEKKGVLINVLGRVAAGIPLEAIEDIIDTEEIPEEMAQTGTFFGLKIHGDSMQPRICDGDVVIVRQQEDAETGDIVIALVNGDDATCKRLRKYHDGIELIANNPTYGAMFFSNEEILSKPVRIIGKVVELRAKF